MFDELSEDQKLIWAAGLFEGEGCFYVAPLGPRGKSRRVRACLGMKDRDVVERFANVMGRGGIYESTHNDKPYFSWQLARATHVKEVALRLLPYLGARRAAKAKEVIVASETVKSRSWQNGRCGRGHDITDPQNVYIYADRSNRRQKDKKLCRLCRAENQVKFRAKSSSSR